MKVSVSVSVLNFGYAWYQYQYQYRNFRPAEYQYRIGIEFLEKESISIVSVSKKVVSKGSGVCETSIHSLTKMKPVLMSLLAGYCAAVQVTGLLGSDQ